MLLGSTSMSGMTYVGNLVCTLLHGDVVEVHENPALASYHPTHACIPLLAIFLILKSQYYCSGYADYSCHVDNGNYSQYRQALMKS